jgi:hypothetical protein
LIERFKIFLVEKREKENVNTKNEAIETNALKYEFISLSFLR